LATSRLQAARSLASISHVVSDGISTFICAKYAVLCRRRDDWRRDARRWFSSVVFSDILRPHAQDMASLGLVTIDVTLGVGLLASVPRLPLASN
jgi:hypothetical protein